MIRQSLRHRVMIGTASIVAALVAIILVMVSRVADQTANEFTAGAKQRTTFLFERTLAEESDHLHRLATFMATQPSTISVLQADFPTISDYLSEMVSRSGAKRLLMYDHRGQLIGKSDQAIDTANDTPLSVAAALTGKSWRGAEQLAQGPELRVAVPIQQGDYLRGVLVAGVPIDSAFLDSMGKIVGVQLTFPKQETGSSHSIHWISEVRSGDGAEPLRVAATLPRKQIVGPLDSLKTMLAWLFFAALLASVGASLSFAISLTRPLEAMVVAAQELGRGLWPAPFQSRRQDEIGVLQNTFDQMSHDLQEHIRKLESMLDVDPLTELFNHRAFRERLGNDLGRIDQNSRAALILMNLDAFDLYNRKFGAEQSDNLLRKAAELIRHHIPVGAIAGRYGGDEFMIYATDTDADALAETLRNAVAKLGITASFGCALHSEHIPGHDLMILAAEMAAQQAKVAGRNRVRVLQELPAVHDVDQIREALGSGSYAAVRALAEAVDAKDEYTRGHSQRVAEYARDLARYCGYDEGFVELVYITGTLHDVGKIGVPDAVLKKQDRLTTEEFQQIMLHPTLGEKIVSQLPHLAETLPGVRNHHERYDGTGYPDRLAGTDIPLLARILAIADTYDAMTSDRPYRPGLEVEFTLQEITRNVGVQFDPELAEKFVQMMHERLDLTRAA